MNDEALGVEARLLDYITDNLPTIEAALRTFSDNVKSQVNEPLQRSNDLLADSSKRLADSWDLVKIGMTSLVGAAGGMSIFNQVTQWMMSAHDAAQELRTSETLITLQLGHYSDALDKQAESMSKALFISKSDILQADQHLLIYTHEENAIKELIPYIVDLAKLKGMDLTTAANMVGRAFKQATDAGEGHQIVIRGLAINFRSAGTEAENLAIMENKLKESIGGSAKAVADSLDGWSKLSINTKQVMEHVGEIIFGTSAEKKAQEDYNTALKEEAATLKSLKGLRSGGGSDLAIKQAEKSLAAEQKIIFKYKTKEAADQKKHDDDEADQKKADLAEHLEILNNETLKLTLKGQLQLLKSDEEAEIKKWNDRAAAVKLYGPQIAKLQAEINKQGLVKKEEPEPGRISEEDLPWYMNPKFIKAEWEKTHPDLEKINKDRIALDKEYDASIAALGKAGKNSPLAIKKAEYAEQKALLQEQQNEELVRYADVVGAKEKIDKIYKNKKDALDKEMHQMEMASIKSNLDSTTSTLGQLASAHKEFFGIYKGFAVAQATWDTYSAATAAFKSAQDLPFGAGAIVGPIEAAAAIAFGISNVQHIIAEEPKKYALGTNFAPGGPSTINEYRPEQVFLPRGAQVVPQDRGQTSQGGDHYHFHADVIDHSAVDRFEKMLPAMLERAVDNRRLTTFNSKLKSL